MHKLLRKPSPAMVVACLALFLAGTGTGAAVLNALPKNSVGTAQLKNNAVTSIKVKNKSLRKVDFAAGQLPAGAKGDTGLTGLTGLTGPTGPTGAAGASAATNVALHSAASSSIANDGSGDLTVNCGTGERAISGGFASYPDVVADISGPVPYDGTVPLTGWRVRMTNYSGSSTTFWAYVICVSP